VCVYIFLETLGLPKKKRIHGPCDECSVVRKKMVKVRYTCIYFFLALLYTGTKYCIQNKLYRVTGPNSGTYPVFLLFFSQSHTSCLFLCIRLFCEH